MSEEPEPIPKVIRELEDYPDIIDLLYAYYEFSQYVWERLCDYNAPETSDNPSFSGRGYNPLLDSG